MDIAPGDITELLRAASAGDTEDLDRLMVAIYDDLRRLAAGQLAAERREHTLRPTALVHEAYLRLVNQHSAQWHDRLHFFAIASRIIRRILIDHARERRALKRGGGHRPISLERDDIPAPEAEVDLLALDEALEELASLSERQARVFELRFFGGLTIPEIGAVLSISPRSVDREWQVARAWLYRRLAPADAEGADAGAL